MKELDSKHKMVKEQVNMMYDLIKTGKRALEILRTQCDHPESELVNYSWAPGHVQNNTKVCAVCGHVFPINYGIIDEQYEKNKNNLL